MTTPLVTYFQKATSSFRARATIVVFRIRPPLRCTRSKIRPGSRQITDRLCRALAAYLNPPGPARDRAFNEIAACYAARGGAVHAGDLPEAEEFHAAFRLARAAIIQCIEEGRLPDIDALLDRWRSRT